MATNRPGAIAGAMIEHSTTTEPDQPRAPDPGGAEHDSDAGSGTAGSGDGRDPADRDRRDWLRALIGIVASPQTSFEIIRRQQLWVGVLLLIVAATVIDFAMTGPGFLEDIGLAVGDNETSSGLGTAFMLVIAAGLAVFVPVSLVFTALVIWLLAVAFRGDVRFRQSFSLVVHLYVIAFLDVQVTYLLFRNSDIGPTVSPSAVADAMPSIGLDRLIPTNNAVLETVLASIDPFAIWYYALLALGSAAVFGLSKRSGLAIAAIYWAAGTGLMAGLTYVNSLLPSTLH